MKIYHYTSIESLYLMIKNKSLRFSTLANVDDINEGMTQEFEFAQQYLFVSCWTEEKRESIPQWAVYSNNMEGIRIGVEIREEEPEKIFKLVEDPITNKLVSEELGFERNLPLMASTRTPFYRKMKYSEDQSKLNPTIISPDPYGTMIDMSKVALYKSLEWSFQTETRFIFDFVPSPFNTDMTANKKFNLLKSLNDQNLPFNYKDIGLSDYFFENIEITFGPRCSSVHKEFVEMYLDNFGVNALLKDSYLNIR